MTTEQTPAAPGYLEAHETTAFFDVSDRTRLEMVGSDGRNFLHNFCTNEIHSLPDGLGCEAFLLNAKGRILGHIFVATEGDRLWISSVPGQAQPLLEHLEKYHLLEEFQLRDRSAETAEFLVTGPEAAKTLASCGVDVSNLQRFQSFRFQLDDECDVFVQRLDLLAFPDFLLTSTESAPISRQLLDQGAVAGSSEAFESLRVEAGFAVYGIDLSSDNLAQEAGRTETAISFTKGCYLGQEPVARIHALGHVNRQLRVLRISDGEMPPTGTAILNPRKPEKEIGLLTSVAWSWKHNSALAIATVRSQFSSPGTELPLVGNQSLSATVLGAED